MTLHPGSAAHKVLDHGYVKLIESWGSDERVIESARMSTNKGFEGWGPVTCPKCAGLGVAVPSEDRPVVHTMDLCDKCKGTGTVPGDEKLLRFLYEHAHHTPFEMAGMTIEVQAPIFVFREWHRHRTQSYNEMSARYTPLPDVNYLPTIERCMMTSSSNKQAQSVNGTLLSADAAMLWFSELDALYAHAERVYQKGLKVGIPKELARLPVPVGRYSRMRASANLRNWLAFLTLRMDSAAQWEIRQFANVVAQFVSVTYPRTYELFNEKRSV